MSTPTPPRVPTTPRGKFIALPENIKQHRALLDNAAYQRGTEVALAEYVRGVVQLAGTNSLVDNNVPFAMAACFSKISGAHEFLEVMNVVAEPYSRPQAAPDKIKSLESLE